MTSPFPAPCPSPDEQNANEAFDALMRAMARPGSKHDCGRPAQLAVLTCLVDQECSVAIADDALRPALRRTGGRDAAIHQADYVFLRGLDIAETLAELKRGSDLYPDTAATAVIGAQFDTGAALCLTGPGIDGRRVIQIGGLPSNTWMRRAEAIRYPMGIDIILTDGDWVMGLPRSTSIEVL